MSVSSLHSHPPCQDSQDSTLREQVTAASQGQVTPPEAVPAPPPPIPREWQDWMGSVNSFMARMETLFSTRSRSPPVRHHRTPSPRSASPRPASESWNSDDDDQASSSGAEVEGAPLPKRPRLDGGPFPASSLPGPSSSRASSGGYRGSLPRDRGDDHDYPASSSVLYDWAALPGSLGCQTIDGKLRAIAQLPNGQWGPIPDLEVRRSKDDEGMETFLYRRVPFSRQDAPLKVPVVSPAAAFDALASLLSEPQLTREGLPRIKGSPEARWLSPGGQSQLPWGRAGLDTTEVWRAGDTKKTQGPPTSWNPVPVLPASGGFPREIAEFLREPRLTAKDLPWQAQTVKEDFFRRDFQERQHASVLASCTAFFGQLAEWFSYLGKAPSTLSPASVADICKVLATSCNAFGASLFPTVRPAIDSAVAARLSLRREAFRAHPESTRHQLLRIGPFAPGILPDPLVQQCLSSLPPTINVVTPQVSRSSLAQGSKKGSGREHRDFFRREGRVKSLPQPQGAHKERKRPLQGGPRGKEPSRYQAPSAGRRIPSKDRGRGRPLF